MKQFFAAFAVLICLSACNSKGNIPDTDNIKVILVTERFEEKLFDTTAGNLANYLQHIQSADPAFTSNFLQNILGIDPATPTDSAGVIVNEMVKYYRSVYDTSEKIFHDFSKYEAEIIQGLKLVKYYFPSYKIPGKIITYIGPADGYGDALSPEGILVGLHHHLGKNFPLYKTEMVQQFYPEYISRRFEPEYISVNCFKNIVNDMYPEKTDDKALVNQMIEKGKRLYLLQQFLPNQDEYRLIGYTDEQLKDSYKHEAVIWDLFVKNNLLQTTDKNIIKNYVEEGPKTQELGEGAPGNIGSFTGWQIVRKYLAKNSSVTPQQLMALDAETIFQEAKYKP